MRFVSITEGISGISLVAKPHCQYSPTLTLVKENQLTSCQSTSKREAGIEIKTVSIAVNYTVTELKGANRGVESY